MIDTVAAWTADEIAPAMHVLGELVLGAFDSIPLPLLVVVFLALLASLKPQTQPHLLPSYSPALSEKTRLSPSPASPPFFPLNPSFRSTTFYPATSYVAAGAGAEDPAVKSTYVAVVDNPSSAVGGHTSPKFGRRGSRRFGWDRRRSSGLSVLESVDEKAEV